MDLIYKRYSNPLALIDTLIDNQGLSDYITTLNEQVTFEYEFKVWLHKVDDKTFDDWRKRIHTDVEARNVTMNKDEIKTTVLKSSNILNSFVPQTEVI